LLEAVFEVSLVKPGYGDQAVLKQPEESMLAILSNRGNARSCSGILKRNTVAIFTPNVLIAFHQRMLLVIIRIDKSTRKYFRDIFNFQKYQLIIYSL
jgi:hypothetical protein